MTSIWRHRVHAMLIGFTLLALLPLQPASAEPEQPTEKDLDKIVEAATEYFDLGVDLWRGRQAFLGALEPHAKKGYELFSQMDMLRQVIYRARFFEPQMSNKKWRQESDIKQWDNKGQDSEIKAEDLFLGFTLPKKYPKKNKVFHKQPRPAPWPLLISTIEREDYTGQKIKSAALLKRRYPKNKWDDFRQEWITLIPIAPGGVYIDDVSGQLKREYLQWQFVQFVRHYHVDFDRVVLDGGPEVLLAASSQPVTFAGFVLRDGTLSKAQADTVTNFAHVPVYVVESQKALGEALKTAGHPNVTIGDDGETLIKWIKERKRTVPTEFTWRLNGPEHQFAHWINCEQVQWRAPKRELKVKVDKEKNEIQIEAIAVAEISLFLNDEIVDLGKKVRVVVNGHLERDETVTRSLDVTFNRDPLRLRKSMYFGLLFPVRMVKIGIRPPAKAPEKVKPTTPTADPEVEAKAVKYWGLVQKALDAGNKKKAIQLLEAIVKMGHTSVLEQAKKKLAELKA